MIAPIVPHGPQRATLAEIAELVAKDAWDWCCIPETEVIFDPSADDWLCKWVDHAADCPALMPLVISAESFRGSVEGGEN